MVTIYFKNVGQGDSIILEWSNDGKKYFGIIDCNIFEGRNPTLEYLKHNSDKIFHFIVLSHFHRDHFSGMADIFQYCIDNKIKVSYFYHSLAAFLGEIYNRIFTSKRVEQEVVRFLEAYETFDKFVAEKILVHDHVVSLKLDENIFLKFLAPASKTYEIMQKQIARKVNKIVTTSANPNKLATIISIHNEAESILLTSDAVKKSFYKTRKAITTKVVLAQSPHHGSFLNIDEIFWTDLKRKESCPIVFSVGDEPKDRLPNQETVAFFDKRNYDIYSTNNVYGITEHFGLKPVKFVHEHSAILNAFSKLRKITSVLSPSDKYNGDQMFCVL